jgi:PAS domain S-box-containing protein
MVVMLDSLLHLFDTSDFPSRWHCGQWSDTLGWLHILSDLSVWSAYFTIPGILGYFVLRRKDLPFRGILLLFGAFILACGTTHLVDAIIFWWPVYRLAGIIKLVTAIVSWITVIALVPIVPKVLAMRAPEALEGEILARKQAELAFQQANVDLERRVQERTTELMAANAALRHERERFHITLASIGDAVIATNTDGNIVFLNEVAQSLTGWPQVDAIGQPLESVFRIVDEETRQTADNSWMELLREDGGAVHAHPKLLLTRDGRERSVDESTAPVRDEQGNIVGVVVVFRDVTEQRRKEKQLRQATAKLQERATELETVMNVAPAAIWISHDTECRNIIGNQRSNQLLRIADGANASASAPGKRPFQEYRNGNPAPIHELPMQKAASTGTEVRGAELELTFEDGEVRHIYGNAVPLFDRNRKVRGAVAAFLDITELKRAELALKEADQRKDEFLATLAHELRNPLAPLHNAVQLLRAIPLVDPPLVRIRDMIERQVHHMVRLVDDLMDVSRITRGKISLQLERIDIAVVVHSALEISRPLIEAGRHELTLQLPAHPVLVVGDLTRLAEVFANLLNNAAKYTPEGGHIWLTIAEDRDGLQISVRDDGIGIPPPLLSQVFELFMQVDRRVERARGGLGIGLTLVKRLVEMHGGTVEAKSEGQGRGSEFFVRLPVAREPSEPSPCLAEQRKPPSSNLRILVVDDNKDAAKSLGLLLQLGGHEVEVAYDGPSALERAPVFRPEVVLLDIGMPRMSGYEVARRVRQMKELQDVVLVAQTGWGQEKDRLLSTEAGFNAHLVKPVALDTIHQLLTTVRRR